MMKMASGDDFPLWQVPKRGLDWFFVAEEACGGGTSVLGLFMMVSLFIEFFGIGFMSRWASRWARYTWARLGGLARPGGLCPPRGSSVPPTKLRGSLLFQKKSSKSFIQFRELLFLHKKQHHGSSTENSVSLG